MRKLSESFFGENIGSNLPVAVRSARALLKATTVAIVAMTWACMASAQTGTTLDKISFSTLPGDRVQVARIENQDSGFLRFIDEKKLAPGAMLTVMA